MEPDLQRGGAKNVKLGNKRLIGTAFVLPAFIIHLMIVTLPAFAMVYFAMTDWNGLSKANFVGFDNFIRMAHDMDFLNSIKNNLVWMSLFLIIPLILGLGLALLITSMGKEQIFYRTMCFLPYVICSVIAGKVFSAFYSPYSGIGPLLNAMGITAMKDFAPLGNKSIALFAVAFVDNWHWWGFVLVLMMSALHQVDASLYEAAVLEGINPVQKLFYITLPQIRASIISYFIFIIVASFKTFDYVWVMTSGGPAGATELAATWIYKRTFVNYEAGYGSALSLTVCMGCLIIYIIQSRITAHNRKKGGELA